MPTETKPLEFIQAIVARLAANSFQMKAWNVALTSAVIGFAVAKDATPKLAVLAVIPSLAFWALDAYYLGLERLYRVLYATAIKEPIPSYDLNAGKLKPALWATVFWSVSVYGIHLPMVLVILIVSLTGTLR